MDLVDLYPAAVNSKATVTLGVLNADTTTIEVLDATVLPDAPNLLVLGTDQTAETVLMKEKNGNTLTVERGVQGNAIAWPAGTQIARNFTAKDWNDVIENIRRLFAEIGNAYLVSPNGSKYKLAMDDIGVYLHPVDEESGVAVLSLGDDANAQYFVETENGETHSIDNAVGEEEELTEGNYNFDLI